MIEELKENVDKLEFEVWEEQEEYKNLMFHKECMDESQENEIEILREVLKKKDILIKEVNHAENDAITITHNKLLQKESDNSEMNKIKDAKKQQKFYCDDCLFRSSSQNEFNEHLNNRHNKDHK